MILVHPEKYYATYSLRTATRLSVKQDGQTGYEKYIELKPDLVTLDITMPVLDGLGSLEKIMELDSSAKVIMVTAAGQKSKMVEAIKLGASEFIQKPFEPDQILSVIKTVI